MPRQTKLSIVDDAPLSGVEPKNFYQTPNWMAMKAIKAKFTSSDWCVWSYLQMIDPFGDRLRDIPNPEEIAEAVGLSAKQVRRCLAKIEELGFYEFQITAIKGRNLAGKGIQRLRDKVVPEKTKLSDSGQSCPARDKVVPEKTKLSDSGQSCPKSEPEPLPSKNPRLPHTLTDSYKTFIDSLSDSERESFLDFGWKKAKEQKTTPSWIHSWVQAGFESLAEQWRESEGKTAPAASQDAKWENDPRREEWLAEIANLRDWHKFTSIATNHPELVQRGDFYDWVEANDVVPGLKQPKKVFDIAS